MITHEPTEPQPKASPMSFFFGKLIPFSMFGILGGVLGYYAGAFVAMMKMGVPVVDELFKQGRFMSDPTVVFFCWYWALAGACVMIWFQIRLGSAHQQGENS